MRLSFEVKGIWIALFLIIALQTASAASAPLLDQGPKAENLIDIGGRRLNLECHGTGAPTVIFLQGAGSNITIWKKISSQAARLSRACFYDRAGFGYSDPSPRPLDLINVTNDLDALITAAHLPLPVVLVGHSLGGYYATTYARRLPSKVGGLVLVDPSFAGQFEYDPNPKDKAVVVAEFEDFIRGLKRCATLARAGNLSLAENAKCFTMPPDLTSAESGYLEWQYTRPRFYEGSISEQLNFHPGADWTTSDDEEAKTLPATLGSIPLEVLTAGVPETNPRKSDEGNQNFAQRWRRGHDALAAMSTRGENIVVEGSGHAIQLDKPDAVIDAIRKVVALVRNEK